MNIDAIIETVRLYSNETKEVLALLEKYDYREEANHWEEPYDPKLFEPEHPTLRGLYERLNRFMVNIDGRDDNFPRDAQLSRNNIQMFNDYLNVEQDLKASAKFLRISKESMKGVADKFYELNLLTEARRFENIYNFVLSTIRWHSAMKHGNGTVINLVYELNYDEATPQEKAENAGEKMFCDLFKASCNYTSKQRKSLYRSLEALYGKNDDNRADKVVMAVILILRTCDIFLKPFSDHGIEECKRIVFASLNRDSKGVSSYSDNSLFSAPKIGRPHVNTAETIIKEAFSLTR